MMDRVEAIKYLDSIATDMIGSLTDAPNDNIAKLVQYRIDALDMAIAALREQGKADTQSPLPCKIGDVLWGIRFAGGRKMVCQGVVSEMYYLDGMALSITLRHVCRGEFGKKIFATEEEAQAALQEQNGDG